MVKVPKNYALREYCIFCGWRDNIFSLEEEHYGLNHHCPNCNNVLSAEYFQPNLQEIRKMISEIKNLYFMFSPYSFRLYCAKCHWKDPIFSIGEVSLCSQEECPHCQNPLEIERFIPSFDDMILMKRAMQIG